ncbi:MAG: hypothetical protein ACE5KC_03670 [Candidatus Bathyarchaeia archaeon]
MRADYGFYVVAIICFMIAALPYTNVISEELLKPGSAMSITVTAIFAALGLISIILGYSQRPKPIITIPEAPKPALPPSPPHALPPTEETTAASLSELTPPTPAQEETVKPERKKPKAKTRRKRTRRRRKKA